MMLKCKQPESLVTTATAATAGAATAGGAGAGLGRATGDGRTEDGKLDGGVFGAALGTGDFLLAVDNDFFELGFAIVADVFVDGHARLRMATIV
jgi:hypothetical protein